MMFMFSLALFIFSLVPSSCFIFPSFLVVFVSLSTCVIFPSLYASYFPRYVFFFPHPVLFFPHPVLFFPRPTLFFPLHVFSFLAICVFLFRRVLSARIGPIGSVLACPGVWLGSNAPKLAHTLGGTDFLVHARQEQDTQSPGRLSSDATSGYVAKVGMVRRNIGSRMLMLSSCVLRLILTSSSQRRREGKGGQKFRWVKH